MSYDNTGRVWTPASLAETLAKATPPRWVTGITLHHMAAPSLAQRPRGLTVQHLENLRAYYRDELGWKAGPQFFTDEDQVFGLSPWTAPGTHAKSFNATHLGIEVLGDYDSEDPTTGRGLACWQTAAATVRVLLDWLNLKDSAVNFHRDDPKTTKTCPGRLVKREFVLGLMKQVTPVAQPQEEQLVPVVATLAGLGVSERVAALHLTRDEDGTRVFGQTIDHAIYRANTTLAPLSELMALNIPASALEARV
jgi:hypothetical protein